MSKTIFIKFGHRTQDGDAVHLPWRNLLKNELMQSEYWPKGLVYWVSDDMANGHLEPKASDMPEERQQEGFDTIEALLQANGFNRVIDEDGNLCYDADRPRNPPEPMQIPEGLKKPAETDSPEKTADPEQAEASEGK